MKNTKDVPTRAQKNAASLKDCVWPLICVRHLFKSAQRTLWIHPKWIILVVPPKWTLAERWTLESSMIPSSSIFPFYPAGKENCILSSWPQPVVSFYAAAPKSTGRQCWSSPKHLCQPNGTGGQMRTQHPTGLPQSSQQWNRESLPEDLAICSYQDGKWSTGKLQYSKNASFSFWLYARMPHAFKEYSRYHKYVVSWSCNCCAISAFLYLFTSDVTLIFRLITSHCH